jgi:uncharacterized membrane protein
VRLADHPVAAGLETEWPALLGYNRLAVKPGADPIVTAGDDPLLVAWRYGRGRAAVFASDCGPHWAPPTFCAWPGYGRLWANIAAWLTAAT